MRAMMKHRWIAALVAACWTVTGAIVALAQDATPDPSGGTTSSTTTTTTVTNWYSEPWAWAVGVGVAVFLIVIIAITNRGSRHST